MVSLVSAYGHCLCFTAHFKINLIITIQVFDFVIYIRINKNTTEEGEIKGYYKVFKKLCNVSGSISMFHKKKKLLLICAGCTLNSILTIIKTPHLFLFQGISVLNTSKNLPLFTLVRKYVFMCCVYNIYVCMTLNN